MPLLPASCWEPVGKGFIRGEIIPNGEPLWQGHTQLLWCEVDDFPLQSRISLSALMPTCSGDVLITAITPAAEVVAGETGVWIDFQGIGPLSINGEPVCFVQ